MSSRAAFKNEHQETEQGMWTLSGFADEIDDDFEKQCTVLDRLGIRNIELRSAWGVNVLDLSDDQVGEVKQVLRRHGIAVSSIGSPIGKIGVDEDFEPHLARHDVALQRADQLGAPYIRLFSFFIPKGQDPDLWRDEVLRRMSALAARSEGRDVTLLHENEKEIYGDIPRRCLDIVESVGLPVLKLAWDAANFVQCGVRPFTEGYATLRPHLAYMQIKDAVVATGEVVPAGAGDGETVETLRALRDDGFDGYFSLEPHLKSAGALGGFSGEDLFAKAHEAFTALLRAEGMDFR
jgi:sugar phosphate isomerase/epimerase